MHLPLTRRTLTLALLPLLGGLAACGSDDATPVTDSPTPEAVPTGEAAASIDPTGLDAAFPPLDATVEKDQAHWALPTDPYLGSSLASLEAHAYETVRLPCMHEAGWTDMTMRTNAFAPIPETVAHGGIRRLFDENLAAKYGYRQAPDPRDLLEADAAAPGGIWADKPAEFWDDFDRCDLEAKKVIDPELEQRMADQAANPNEAPDPAAADTIKSRLSRVSADLNTPTLRSAAASWRDCMAPLGIPDLPSIPWEPNTNEMPPSLVERWAWTPAGTPSSEEVAYATHDGQCRRSSGWFDTLYEAEWKAAEEFVAANKADLDPILAKNNEDRKRYLAIIAGETPTQ